MTSKPDQIVDSSSGTSASTASSLKSSNVLPSFTGDSRATFLNISLRIQKKLASKLASKKFTHIFLDDLGARLYNNLTRLVQLYTNDVKLADKLMRYVIKLNVKLILLVKNDVLNEEESNYLGTFNENLHDGCDIIIQLGRRRFRHDVLLASGASLQAKCNRVREESMQKQAAECDRDDCEPNKLTAHSFQRMMDLIQRNMDILHFILERHTTDKTKTKFQLLKAFLLDSDFIKNIFLFSDSDGGAAMATNSTSSNAKTTDATQAASTTMFEWKRSEKPANLGFRNNSYAILIKAIVNDMQTLMDRGAI